MQFSLHSEQYSPKQFNLNCDPFNCGYVCMNICLQISIFCNRSHITWPFSFVKVSSVTLYVLLIETDVCIWSQSWHPGDCECIVRSTIFIWSAHYFMCVLLCCRRTECNCTINLQLLPCCICSHQFQHIPCVFSKACWLETKIQGEYFIIILEEYTSVDTQCLWNRLAPWVIKFVSTSLTPRNMVFSRFYSFSK